jgi:hypothetical protein
MNRREMPKCCFIPLPKPSFKGGAAQLRTDGFATGLCDCCAAPGGCALCAYVWCCTCCAYGHLAEKLPVGVTIGSGDFCVPCFVSGVFTFIPRVGDLFNALLFHAPMRKALLPVGYKAHPGCAPGAEVCCTTACCGPCALIQELNEVAIRQKSKVQITVFKPPGTETMMGQ